MSVKKSKVGRPTKFTAKVKKTIIKAIEDGVPYTCACGLACVTYNSFLNWMQKGQEEKTGPYFDFFSAVKEAEAKAEQFHVDNIKKHSYEQWQASAWLLERRHNYRKPVERIEQKTDHTFGDELKGFLSHVQNSEVVTKKG